MPDARRDVAPAARVGVFLLAPHQPLQVGVALELSLESAHGERAQLLHGGDGDVADLVLSDAVRQVEVDLPAAEDQGVDGSDVGHSGGNHRPEAVLRSELLQAARLVEFTQHLAPQSVEEVAGSGAVDDGDVGAACKVFVGERQTVPQVLRLVGKLQVALDAGGAVVWALAVVPVRQQEAHGRALGPLGLATNNELVSNSLGNVGEVAELRLPDVEDARALQTVAVLKGHGGSL
ncbi:uncharacterized protein BcabD6B2_34980 [Babesia caballi]|uniref:Uncharacterized protein n=1 Tax=Babesia caballi TaxID=5871 RepID=A0AAV4LV66_BABCB|nr:hypothetical protein BcabD6B2_34980 [Babesia caballi]